MEPVRTPAENQQTVEAALCPNWPHPETIACTYCEHTEEARAALRDLAAQAELAAELGEALQDIVQYARTHPTASIGYLAHDGHTDALLARLEAHRKGVSWEGSRI